MMDIALGVTLQAGWTAERIMLGVDTPPLTNFTFNIEENIFLWETSTHLNYNNHEEKAIVTNGLDNPIPLTFTI